MTLVWIVVGALIGWNFPQPAYAKAFQAWIVAKFKEFTDK